MEFLGMAFVMIKFCRYVTAIHCLCQYLFVRDCIFFMTLHVTYGLVIKVRYSAKRLIMLELKPVSVPVQRQRIFICLNAPTLPHSPLPRSPLPPSPSPHPIGCCPVDRRVTSTVALNSPAEEGTK